MARRKCKSCREWFNPVRPLQIVCSLKCAKVHAVFIDEKKKAKQLEQRREALKPKGDFIKLAQHAFNAYIRERDKDLPCISCGKNHLKQVGGGAWDAGHFLTRGAFPELRFNEDNCHRQCKRCNGGAGRYSRVSNTVQQAYRIELIKRIGQEAVDVLEGPHAPAKWTIDDLKEIAATYRNKRRELRERNQD